MAPVTLEGFLVVVLIIEMNDATQPLNLLHRFALSPRAIGLPSNPNADQRYDDQKSPQAKSCPPPLGHRRSTCRAGLHDDFLVRGLPRQRIVAQS